MGKASYKVRAEGAPSWNHSIEGKDPSEGISNGDWDKKEMVGE